MRTRRSHRGRGARSRRPLAVAALGTGLSALLLALSPGVTLADVPPAASFVVSANYGPELPVQFDASKSSDPDGTIVKYTWTFGDGSEGSGVAPAHTYSGIGSYEVTLTVEDDAHLTAMTKGSVAVEQAQTIGFTSTAPEAAMVGGATQPAHATATSRAAGPCAAATPPPKPPAVQPNSDFAGHASYNTKTGAITVDVTVSTPGRFAWRATFANGKFGVFAAARTKCRGGQLRLQGKCRRAAITFGKGVAIVTGAGPLTCVSKPRR